MLLLLALVIFPKISRAADDAAEGKQVFEKRCTGCHSLERNKVGPNLTGSLRQAGGNSIWVQLFTGPKIRAFRVG